jgi:hypothetical protein
MTDKLCDQLIGAFGLVSFVEKLLKGSPPNYPMGEKGLWASSCTRLTDICQRSSCEKIRVILPLVTGSKRRRPRGDGSLPQGGNPTPASTDIPANR